MQLQVIVLMCLVGLMAATSPEAEVPAVMTERQLSDAIYDLVGRVARIKAGLQRMRSIGIAQIRKLNQ